MSALNYADYKVLRRVHYGGCSLDTMSDRS